MSGSESRWAAARRRARIVRARRRRAVQAYLAALPAAPDRLTDAPEWLIQVSTRVGHPAVAHDCCARFASHLERLAQQQAVKVGEPPRMVLIRDDAGFWDASAVFPIGTAAEDFIAAISDLAARLGLDLTVTHERP